MTVLRFGLTPKMKPVSPKRSALVAALDAVPDSRRIVLEKLLGETVVKENTPPDWAWPSR